MSKVGKKPIEVPEGIKITRQANGLIIKGPLGESVFMINPNIEVKEDERQLIVTAKKSRADKFTRAMWGTTRAILANKIAGLIKPFQAELILEGLGYAAEVKDNVIVFKLGYNHPVNLSIPADIKIEVKPQKGHFIIIVGGVDKEKTGQFAGVIRKLKPAEPYKAKGFRYVNEKIKRKTVKKLGK